MRENLPFERCRLAHLCVFLGNSRWHGHCYKNLHHADSCGSYRLSLTEKTKNQKCYYEKTPEKGRGVYLDRIVSRHRDYRHFGGDVVAGACWGQCTRTAY